MPAKLNVYCIFASILKKRGLDINQLLKKKRVIYLDKIKIIKGFNDYAKLSN